LAEKKVFEEREKYTNMCIDDFVLEKGSRVQKKNIALTANIYSEKKMCLLLKYEEMICEFKTW
jgi:hypothetical protein